MRKPIILAIMLLMVAVLAGCGAEATPTPEVVAEASPTAVAETPEETAEVPTEAPAETAEETAETLVEEATEEPTAEPEPEPTPEPTLEPTPIVIVDVDAACVGCHTDLDRLKELAEEPEEVHLSSGEG